MTDPLWAAMSPPYLSECLGVKQLLAHQEEQFWVVGWTSTSLDTRAGRDMVLESLSLVARNKRADLPWFEGIARVAVAEPEQHAVAEAVFEHLQNERTGAGMVFPAPSWYTPVMATTTYLDRMLDPVVESLTPAVARKIVKLRADPELEQHIAGLRRKANEGTLSPEEDAEYKDFVESVDVISILQTKASRFLAHHPD